jgi:hypothetical protein
MLHELMHMSGLSHGKDKTGNMGHDKIYACGRWCSRKRCDPIASFDDCAACTGTDFTAMMDQCNACAIAQAAGLACTYQGTTKLSVMGGATAGFEYDGTVTLTATATVTDFMKGPVTIAKGIRYEPTGTIASVFSVAGSGCAISPSSIMISPSSFVGDIIIGIEPRIFGAQCISSVPGSALVCMGHNAPLTPSWSWLLAPGVDYTCGDTMISGMSTSGETSTWSFQPQ